MKRALIDSVHSLTLAAGVLTLSACKPEESALVEPESVAAPEPMPVAAPEPEPEPEPEPGPPVLESTVSSDAADTLAGLSVSVDVWGETPPERLSAYAQVIEADWSKWLTKVGDPMLAFSRQYMPKSEGKEVFYPFSGPDFPTVHRIYPEADRYVLVAMQKAGPPPEPESLDVDELEQMLRVYEEVFANYTRKGFFITTQMNDSFGKDHPVKGLTGLMMAFAAREGFLVESVEPIWISREGKVEPDPGDRSRLRTWDSVRLNLRRRADGKAVKLDYLRLNLADRKISNRPYAMKWVEQMATQLVFVKAASHLMQQTNFEFMRDVLLDKAEAIVQDESGVAYDRLVREHEVTLFGSFKKVNKLFREEPQRPLAEAYQTREDVRELPFRIGYLKAAGSCLQLAVPRDSSPKEG